jgi:hypothetical protein
LVSLKRQIIPTAYVLSLEAKAGATKSTRLNDIAMNLLKLGCLYYALSRVCLHPCRLYGGSSSRHNSFMDEEAMAQDLG